MGKKNISINLTTETIETLTNLGKELGINRSYLAEYAIKRGLSRAVQTFGKPDTKIESKSMETAA